jgi:hypothetical protein
MKNELSRQFDHPAAKNSPNQKPTGIEQAIDLLAL